MWILLTQTNWNNNSCTKSIRRWKRKIHVPESLTRTYVRTYVHSKYSRERAQSAHSKFQWTVQTVAAAAAVWPFSSSSSLRYFLASHVRVPSNFWREWMNVTSTHSLTCSLACLLLDQTNTKSRESCAEETNAVCLLDCLNRVLL